MKQYKVVVLMDNLLTGRFNPERVQLALNELTPAGWRLVEVVTNPVAGGLSGSNDELVMFLEREFVDEASKDDEESWSCPQCKCKVSHGQKRCHNCGETIEW